MKVIRFWTKNFKKRLEKKKNERNSQTGIALKHIDGNLAITPQQQPGRRQGVRWAHGRESMMRSSCQS